MELDTKIGLAVIAVMAGAACAPSETSRETKPVQPHAVASILPAAKDSSNPIARDTAAETAAALSQELPGDTTPVSRLPARYIPDVPGWLDVGMQYMMPDTSGTGPDGPAVRGLGIFPYDTAWKHVGRATALIVLGDSGRATIFPDGVTASDTYTGDEIVLRIRPAETIQGHWIVPRSEADGVQVLPIRDSLALDKLTRIWSAGGARVRLQRTDRRSARMVGEFNGHSVSRKDLIGINPAADSSMGVEDQTDSILDLKKAWMIPEFVSALRFGRTGAVVMIFVESGYECRNIRLVVFRASGVEWIEEPHFYGDCMR